MAKSSYYTPRCMAFKAAFKDMPGVTTFEHELVTYDGQCTDFDGSAYVDKLEWVAIIVTDGKFMVYINNPCCPVDADGCPILPRNIHNNNGCSDITNRLTGL